jgi:hypothetical protein
VRLRALERGLLGAMGAGLPVDLADAGARHALQLAHSVSDNRRALRRFLAAHFRGGAPAPESHVANRAWLARHPRVDAGRWREGIPFARELASGPVTVTLERDPLEVLQLGTRVGSCLGLGGGNEFSAVAALLDVNKRVAYVRDARGRVLARQLLAINAADRLVCHEVYPGSAGRSLRLLVRDFDRALAQALGLEIAGPNDAAAVECLVASRWYDDGAWDLEVAAS